MSDSKPLMVNCGEHGERLAAVLCRHLLLRDTGPLGFIENSSDPEDLQAWCYDCEDVFEREGGMTEAFQDFNDLAIVCVDCYAAAKRRHTMGQETLN